MIRLAAGPATALALLLTAVHPAGATLADDPLPVLVAVEAPAVSGTPRAGQVLRAYPGRWEPRRQETRYRWLRDGEPVRGARERRHRLTALDVGARLSVRVRVRAPGHGWTTTVSTATPGSTTPPRCDAG